MIFRSQSQVRAHLNAVDLIKKYAMFSVHRYEMPLSGDERFHVCVEVASPKVSQEIENALQGTNASTKNASRAIVEAVQ